MAATDSTPSYFNHLFTQLGFQPDDRLFRTQLAQIASVLAAIKDQKTIEAILHNQQTKIPTNLGVTTLTRELFKVDPSQTQLESPSEGAPEEPDVSDRLDQKTLVRNRFPEQALPAAEQSINNNFSVPGIDGCVLEALLKLYPTPETWQRLQDKEEEAQALTKELEAKGKTKPQAQLMGDITRLGALIPEDGRPSPLTVKQMADLLNQGHFSRIAQTLNSISQEAPSIKDSHGSSTIPRPSPFSKPRG